MRNMRRTVLAGLFCTVFLQWGCLPQVFVNVKNDTSSTVSGKAVFSSDQNVGDPAIDQSGSEEDFTLNAGESHAFSRNCNDLKAIKVEGTLQVVAGIGPSNSTKVFRSGTDFNCGDRLQFS